MKNARHILSLNSISALVVVLALLDAPAFGDLTYSISGIGSGTLGSSSFSDAEFTISALGDETQVTNPFRNIITLRSLTAVLVVDGIGTADFLPQLNLTVNQSFSGPNPAVGFGDPNQNLAIFFVTNPVFASYDLQTAYPLTFGTPSFNSGANFATTMGNFRIDSVSSAAFLAVPEPSSHLVLAVGILAHSLRRKRNPMAPTSGRNRTKG